jgi:hypothetical protein
LKIKLYELSDSYQHLLEQMEDTDSDVFSDTLESIQDAIEVKAENTAKVIKTIEAETKAIRDEEKRLADRRKSLENRAKGMKEYLQENLEKSGLNKVKGAVLTVAMQNNPVSVYVQDEKIIPQSFFVQQAPRLDRKSLIDALKNDEKITGAELQQKRSLRIR